MNNKNGKNSTNLNTIPRIFYNHKMRYQILYNFAYSCILFKLNSLLVKLAFIIQECSLVFDLKNKVGACQVTVTRLCMKSVSTTDYNILAAVIAQMFIFSSSLNVFQIPQLIIINPFVDSFNRRISKGSDKR